MLHSHAHLPRHQGYHTPLPPACAPRGAAVNQLLGTMAGAETPRRVKGHSNSYAMVVNTPKWINKPQQGVLFSQHTTLCNPHMCLA